MELFTEPLVHLSDIKVSLQGSIQFIGDRSFATFATLCTPEKRVATWRTVIPFTFCPRPFHATFLITVLGHFCPPYGNRSFHHPQAGGKREILNQTTRPFLTLMARVVSLWFYAIPYSAYIAQTIELFLWIRLHTPETFCIFGFCSVKFSHNRPKFFIAVPCCDVNPARTAI